MKKKVLLLAIDALISQGKEYLDRIADLECKVTELQLLLEAHEQRIANLEQRPRYWYVPSDTKGPFDPPYKVTFSGSVSDNISKG